MEPLQNGARGTLGTPATSGICMRRLSIVAFALAAGLSVAGCDVKTSANGANTVALLRDFAAAVALEASR